MPSIAQLIIFLVIFLLVLLPVILVLTSKRVHGFEKFAWVVGAILFSWIGYIAMVIVLKRRAANQGAVSEL